VSEHSSDLNRLNSVGLLLKAAFRLSMGLALLLLGFVWAGTYFYLQLDRTKSEQAALANTASMARVFEEDVARSIKDIDKTILFIRKAYVADPKGFDLPAWTSNAYLLHDLTVQIALIGPNGFLLSTNVARQPDPMDLSDREHFRVHLNGQEDTLFVSKPVLGRATGKWTVQLTRKILMPDGSFGGVIVASLDPYYLSKFFEQTDLGKRGVISLIGEDGIIRARGGLSADSLGKSIADSSFFGTVKSAVTGHMTGINPLSDERQYLSFRHMRDFPLIVAVAQSETEVLAEYSETRRIFLTIASGLSVIICVVMILGVTHEVRLLRAQAAERASDARAQRKTTELAATLSHMSQGIAMIDADDRIRVINDPAIAFLGLASDTREGFPLPDTARTLLTDRSEVTHPGNASSHEVTLATGTILDVEATSLNDGGQLYTLTDITAWKRNETVLAEARDRAEAGARARTAFLATMSHEIRTPLNGVIGMTQLLEGCDDAVERTTYLRTMRRSAEHLLQIIEDILDMSKLEADRMVLETIPFDISDILRSTTEIVMPRARDKGIVLRSHIAPNVPAVLLGDPARLRQILLNLVGNAVKFTDHGHVAINASILAHEPGASQIKLRVAVADTGIGIAQENISGLFREFSQLDGSITRRFGGTGLGLAISRKLLEKMGGTVSVESREGQGSTFTITIPFGVVAHAPIGVEPVNASTSEGHRNLTILQAEDNPINALVATKILEKSGHTVITAKDGQEAVEVLDAGPFDLVLMDMMMPRMDGLTATRAIRMSGGPHAGIPIIMLTADALAEDRQQALEAGADDFITKPVSADRLRETIERVLAEAASTLRAAS
jgi:signal transduction histidine kinase/ActR/RegA family two-component response regulator